MISHQIGASGARILTTLIYAMKRYDKKHGLVALCIGGGEASALICGEDVIEAGLHRLEVAFGDESRRRTG